MTNKRFYIKDPSAVLDYSFDWSEYLAETSPVDTIASSTWTASSSGITIDSANNSQTLTTVWLSGGTRGSRYKLVNRIVTAGGRTDERTLEVRVQNR